MKSGSRRGWLLGIAGTTAFSAFQAFQVLPRVPGVRWGILFLLELPVWWSWCFLASVIFVLAERFPLDRADWLRNFVIHLAAATLLVIPAAITATEIARELIAEILFATTQLSNREMSYLGPPQQVYTDILFYWRRFVASFATIYFAILALHHAVESQRALYKKSLEERELKAAVAEARLEALRLQLQPHFLFNALNTVSAFMATDLGKAREVLARLGELLHESLKDGASNEITVKREFELLQSYIDIQQIRFGERLVISATYDPETAAALVPNMVLQPLVENAIVHGMRQSGPGLRVTVTGRTEGGTLILCATDDGRGIAAGEVVVENVGIGNTRKRLEQLYGDSALLRYGARQPAGFEAEVRLPLHFDYAVTPRSR